MLFSTNPCPPPRSVTVPALSLVRSVSVECSSGSVVFPPPSVEFAGQKTVSGIRAGYFACCSYNGTIVCSICPLICPPPPTDIISKLLLLPGDLPLLMSPQDDGDDGHTPRVPVGHGLAPGSCPQGKLLTCLLSILCGLLDDVLGVAVGVCVPVSFVDFLPVVGVDDDVVLVLVHVAPLPVAVGNLLVVVTVLELEFKCVLCVVVDDDDDCVWLCSELACIKLFLNSNTPPFSEEVFLRDVDEDDAEVPVITSGGQAEPYWCPP